MKAVHCLLSFTEGNFYKLTENQIFTDNLKGCILILSNFVVKYIKVLQFLFMLVFYA